MKGVQILVQMVADPTYSSYLREWATRDIYAAR